MKSPQKFGGQEGLLPAGIQGETVMREFIESAKRESGDSNIVTILTTAIIAMAAVVMAATSLSLV
jgi:hypothetical protein